MRVGPNSRIIFREAVLVPRAALQQTTESVETSHFHLMSLLNARRSSTMRIVSDRLSFRSVGVRVFFAAIILCALVIPAMAQSTAVLKGSITDPTGAAVVQAKVVVRNQATGVEWNTEADSAGSYLVPSLPIGKYEITVTATGFRRAIMQNIILDAATTVTQNV